jgi:hypothetical protein
LLSQLLGLLLLWSLFCIFYNLCFTTVGSDDDQVLPGSQEPFEEPSDYPSGTRTPPTPDDSLSNAPPPPAPPLRQGAMAQLRPVSIPAVIKDMAGKNIAKTLRDFDGHYMPNGHSDADDSARGFDHAHCSDLKRKAEVISRSLSEVFPVRVFDTWYRITG